MCVVGFLVLVCYLCWLGGCWVVVWVGVVECCLCGGVVLVLVVNVCCVIDVGVVYLGWVVDWVCRW